MLARVFAHEDIAVLTGATVTSLQRDGEEIVATVRQDGCDRTTRAAAVLIATGRRVDVAGLDLDVAGVAVGGMAWSWTTRAHDQSGDLRLRRRDRRVRFTHAAGYQAAVAVRNALLPVRAKLDYRAIPGQPSPRPKSATSG